MASSIDPDNGTASFPRTTGDHRPSRLAVVLGTAASAAVVTAGAFGALTPARAATALGAAGLLAVVSFRGAGGRLVSAGMPPLGEHVGSVLIRAPRVVDLAGRTDRHSDAA